MSTDAADITLAIAQCVAQVKRLKENIESRRLDTEGEQPLQKYVETNNVPVNESKKRSVRRVLKGHFGKIYAMHWASDSQTVASAAQDGKLIIWNAFTSNKKHIIQLRSSWVMTCAFSNSRTLIATGGLDNLCSIHKVPGDGEEPDRKTKSELAQHEGYLSCCRFIGDSEIVTSSGDSTCILWDVEKSTPKGLFANHTGDVMSVSIHEGSNTFVSGSCDATAKLWDLRDHKSSVMTFVGHESDINSVDLFRDGKTLACGSDDSSCRLFDVRSYAQLNKFADDKILCGITSLALSKSGRMLFAGYDDYNCHVWDTLHGTVDATLSGHDNRVSCLGVSRNGKALCTGSWDTLLKVWA